MLPHHTTRLQQQQAATCAGPCRGCFRASPKVGIPPLMSFVLPLPPLGYYIVLLGRSNMCTLLLWLLHLSPGEVSLTYSIDGSRPDHEVFAREKIHLHSVQGWLDWERLGSWHCLEYFDTQSSTVSLQPCRSNFCCHLLIWLHLHEAIQWENRNPRIENVRCCTKQIVD